jgi:hypothetical protein
MALKVSLKYDRQGLSVPAFALVHARILQGIDLGRKNQPGEYFQPSS